MYSCKELQGQKFKNKVDLIKALIENKDTIIATKKAIIKHADSVSSLCYTEQPQSTNKAVKSASNELSVKVVINTTNILDSHEDVHLKGIWKKTVSEKRNLLLLQEHQMKFDKIISDDVRAMVKEYTFKDLGFNYPNTTEALIFDANVSEKRNPFMFEQYKNGYVKEHSVGMQYTKVGLAVSPDIYESEEENKEWEKNIDQVANKQDAIDLGYFYPIYEAKLIEGSAVVKGSNSVTPTLEVKAENITLTNNEPTDVTQEKLKQFYQTILKK